MNATSQDNSSPIYQQLVWEHGDVVAAAEQTAAKAWAEVDDALREFTRTGPSARFRERRNDKGTGEGADLLGGLG